MKINTERVKRKRFAEAIRDEKLKHSQEYRILATIRYLFPGKYENMIVDDAPDLQDEKNSVGIEVVTAIQKSDIQATKILSHREKNLLLGDSFRFECIGYNVNELPNGAVSINRGGTIFDEEQVFKETITKKNKKASHYRTLFPVLGLAILLQETCTSEAENSFVTWIKQKMNDEGTLFDFFYIISDRFCLYYDVTNNMEYKYNIESKENRLLRTLGRMTAEGEITLDDEEWNDTEPEHGEETEKLE